MTGRSTELMESMRSLPSPGQEKMVSVTVVKAIREPISIPNTVITGIKAFFRACPKRTFRVDTPLARANLI